MGCTARAHLSLPAGSAFWRSSVRRGATLSKLNTAFTNKMENIITLGDFMRYLTVLFASFVLAACSTGTASRTESHSAGSTQGPAAELQKASVDSVVQFLISSAASDFLAHGPSPVRFRDLRIGHDMKSMGETRYILCGQVLRVQDGGKTDWVPFATIKTSGYEQYLGALASTFCQGSSFTWDTDGDLSSRLQSRLDSLRGAPH